MSESSQQSPAVVPPHGSGVIESLVDHRRAADIRAASRDWPSWDLTARQLADLELLLSGALSPLSGYLSRADYDAVCQSMRLASGLLWPIPITLSVPAAVAKGLRPGGALGLRDPEGVLLAVLHVDEVWRVDRRAELDVLFGATAALAAIDADPWEEGQAWCVGGPLEGLQLPVHHDFATLRRGPAAVRDLFRSLGAARVIAFTPRTVMHRADVEETRRAMGQLDGALLIRAISGPTRPDDVQHYSRVRCYQAVMGHYPPSAAVLTVSPSAPPAAAPRDLLLQAIINRNYGCTHWIVDQQAETSRAPAATTPGHDRTAGVELLRQHQDELGLIVVSWSHGGGEASGTGQSGLTSAALQRCLDDGTEIPAWFTFPEVSAELRLSTPPRHQRGLTIFFTGLSGSGKSTLANALLARLLEAGGRRATLLDGDLARKHLSSELGFSREHRTLNVRRIGYVAAEVTKMGGIAICALIAPRDAVRQEVRQMVQQFGSFVLLHVATSLEVCEARDRKGLYAKARAGLLPEFTGISDPYETPLDADLSIDTATLSTAAATGRILEFLRTVGYLQ